MRNPKDILVTTTEKIDGIEIIQYIKPISAHVVTGTGFFSDFAASFSDVFGGRSQSYQKQLTSIYNEAIETLKRTAYENGANCIVGLRVDLDEIAGKGKSMFMITAVGTAVIIENPKNKKTEKNEKTESISFERMIEQRQRRSLIQLAKDNKLVLDDKTWDFLSENNVHEIAEEVFIKAKYIHDTFFDEEKARIYQRLLTYLYSLPVEIRIELLYKQIIEQKSILINSKFFLLIKELMAYDETKLKMYLSHSDSDIRGKALQIITNDKPFYSIEDIKTFQDYIEIIKQNFPKYEITSQKKLLSSKEIEIWKCECGEKNELDVVNCSKCGRDIYGFISSEVNPERAILQLTENIEIIKTNIN
jgi:uncharacterized protein YbjQ (UPF0145 family)